MSSLIAPCPPSCPPSAKSKMKKSQVHKENVMGTNSSSGLSKRSVEHLYYTHEPSYFHFFVTKLQRRAPLINRGYLIRMNAVEVLVRQFLGRGPGAKRVVVSLGCGSDVLPWRLNHRYPELCEDATFVDVDYPDLMLRKRQTVLQSPELSRLPTHPSAGGLPVLLRSREYCQVGCNLTQTDVLETALRGLFDASDCAVLFVAEVSITYMETGDADALIRWTSSFPNAEFCLVEQILPQGPLHPFAQKMVRHFAKLNSPIRSVDAYPTVDSQVSRFENRGWRDVRAWTLWETWSSDAFFTPQERRRLDNVEPFDEWEDLAVFGSHYVVLWASTTGEKGRSGDDEEPLLSSRWPDLPSCETASLRRENGPAVPGEGKRRFGSAINLGDPEGSGVVSVAHILGEGEGARLTTCDVFLSGDVRSEKPTPLLDGLDMARNAPSARVCHSLTDLGSAAGVLVAGGRSSPARPLWDCWLFDKKRGTWTGTHGLPVPLYRHSAVRLGNSARVLLVGGKTGPRGVSSRCLVYEPQGGWVECVARGQLPRPAFGATLATAATELPRSEWVIRGMLAGGISEDGVVVSQTHLWELYCPEFEPPIITFTRTSANYAGNPSSRILDPLHRFGAQCVPLGPFTLVVGGVVGARLLFQTLNAVLVRISSSSCEVIASVPLGGNSGSEGAEPLPLLVGSAVVCLGGDGDGNEMKHDTSFAVLGGGAVCFAMGAFWETRTMVCRILSVPADPDNDRPWKRTRISIESSFAESVENAAPVWPLRLDRVLEMPRPRQSVAAEETN